MSQTSEFNTTYKTHPSILHQQTSQSLFHFSGTYFPGVAYVHLPLSPTYAHLSALTTHALWWVQQRACNWIPLHYCFISVIVDIIVDIKALE